MNNQGLAPEFQGRVDVIAAATFEDCLGAFDRFTRECSGQRITGFALNTVDDACPPYITGTTVEDGFGIPCIDKANGNNGFTADPSDWCWSDEPFERANGGYRCTEPIGDVLGDSTLAWEEKVLIVYRGMVEGLIRFDATGRFAGLLAREEMFLVLWIHDTCHEDWLEEWVKQTNPKSVGEWYSKLYE